MVADQRREHVLAERKIPSMYNCRIEIGGVLIHSVKKHRVQHVIGACKRGSGEHGGLGRKGVLTGSNTTDTVTECPRCLLVHMRHVNTPCEARVIGVPCTEGSQYVCEKRLGEIHQRDKRETSEETYREVGGRHLGIRETLLEVTENPEGG